MYIYPSLPRLYKQRGLHLDLSFLPNPYCFGDPPGPASRSAIVLHSTAIIRSSSDDCLGRSTKKDICHVSRVMLVQGINAINIHHPSMLTLDAST